VKGGSTITGTAIADPTIPTVAGEPGATFVFSQLLGINDKVASPMGLGIFFGNRREPSS
jgi:hypothetical protein